MFIFYFFFLFHLSDAEVVWCQEEPMNMSAYTHIAPRLCTAMKALGRGNTDDIKYVGRAPFAATATGFYSAHGRGQTELVQEETYAPYIVRSYLIQRPLMVEITTNKILFSDFTCKVVQFKE